MMESLWKCGFVFYTIAVIVAFAKNKKIITAYNIVYFMTMISFVLYLQKWSLDFVYDCFPETYYLMFVVCLIFGIYALHDNKIKIEQYNKKYYLKKITIGGHISFMCSSCLLILCLTLTAVENLYLSGGLVAPDFNEFHTASMPVIGTVVRGLYPVAYAMAYLDFVSHRKKRTIILTICCIAYALLGAGSRYWSAISLVTFMVFVCEYNKDFFKALTKKTKVLIVLGCVILFELFLNMGMSRTGTQTYAQWIQYNGPFKDTPIGMAFSWFYGYFPYSFNNLNNTLSSLSTRQLYTYGQFTIYPYLAVLHVDSLFGINAIELARECRVISNTAATVATGWYEYYADFGKFFFIQVLVLLFITIHFEKKRDLSGYIGYAGMTCVWCFMSFTNIYTVGIVLYTIFFGWICKKLFAIEIQ